MKQISAIKYQLQSTPSSDSWLIAAGQRHAAMATSALLHTHTHTHVHIFIYLFIYLFICVTYKLGRVVTSTRCNELPCQRQRRFTMESGSAETFRARFLFVESEVSPQTVPFNKDGFLFLFLLIFWSVPCR